MAIPRVFISSTYYDLKHVRNDIELFIKTLGYEPIMHDRGNVTYSQSETLEKSCYNELSTCDIVICVIGNKYGTKASDSDYSITMEELNTAIKAKKKVYIFIVKDVFIENNTYLANKDSGNFKPVYADNIKIHEYISEIRNAVRNHPIKPFETVSEIIDELKIQFAGLFQYLLARESTLTDTKTAYDLQESADKIKFLIGEFTNEKDEFFKKFDSSIFVTNLTLKRIKLYLGMDKSAFFAKDVEALDEFMKVVGFSTDDVDDPIEDYRKYVCDSSDKRLSLTMKKELFEGLKLKEFRSIKKADEYIIWKQEEKDDSDLPF